MSLNKEEIKIEQLLLECQDDLLQVIEDKKEKYPIDIFEQSLAQLSIKILLRRSPTPLKDFTKRYLHQCKKEYLKIIGKLFDIEIKLGSR